MLSLQVCETASPKRQRGRVSPSLALRARESGENPLTEAKIHIIGVGSDGLRGMTSREREILHNAELILGSEAALDLTAELKADRVKTGSDLQEIVHSLEGSLGKK